MMARKHNGFTLIELLIVVVIIGVLTTLAIPQYRKFVIRTKWAAGTYPTLKQIKNAMDLYYDEAGHYPNDISDLNIEGLNKPQDRFWYTIYTPGNEFFEPPKDRRACAELRVEVERVGWGTAWHPGTSIIKSDNSIEYGWNPPYTYLQDPDTYQ